MTKGVVAVFIYCLVLVMSVFLGSQILAIETPVAQITLYRLTALTSLIILLWQVLIGQRDLKLLEPSAATKMLKAFIIWWLIAFITVAWAENLISWIQVFFLMTVGLASILALYFWVDDWHQWVRLVQGAWVMMSGLVAWGYFELLTNIYLFADLTKLDKYNTFSTQAWTRIPITTFANQNDYATMLLAYLAVCTILFYLSQHYLFKLTYLVGFILASFLIYQSGSRMALICLLLFVFLQAYSGPLFAFLRSPYLKWAIVFLFLLTMLPPIREKLSTIVYLDGPQAGLSGDTKRMNSWRNGLIYLVQTFGLGVGSGNIEDWAKVRAFWPTNEITNMHNWWLEILVSNGIMAFVAYVGGYFNLLRRLSFLHHSIAKSSHQRSQVAHSLYAFMLIYILASITSANNMLIEWHWLFFGLIVSFVKIMDQEEFKTQLISKRRYLS